MITMLVHLLILLIVLGVVAWGVLMILDLMPMPDPFKRAAKIVLMVILLLVLLLYLLPLAGIATGPL